jgi:ankyrin repeat protein
MSFSASLLHAIPVAEAGRPFAHSWGYDASLSALLIPSADAISAPVSVPALGLVLVGLLQAHRTLLKSLSSSLSSHLPLQAAAWQLCEHAWARLFSALDARVGAARAYESLMHWDKLLHGRPSGSLLAEGRKLLFHGELSRKGARDIRVYFLFTDMLVETKRDTKASGGVRKPSLRRLLSASGGSYAPVRDEALADRQHRWKSELPISACSVRVVGAGSEAAASSKTFVVLAPSACHECTASSSAECQKWLDALAGCITASLESLACSSASAYGWRHQVKTGTLHWACLSNNVGEVCRLVASLDASAVDEEGVTPLHCAAASGSTMAARLLLSHGAQAGATDSGCATPLHVAVAHNREAVVTLLVQHSVAELSARNAHGNTPIHLAALCGDDRTSQLATLLRSAHERDATALRRALAVENAEGLDLLELSLRQPTTTALRTLLEAGVYTPQRVHGSDDDGFSVAHRIALQAHPNAAEMVALLYAHGWLVDLPLGQKPAGHPRPGTAPVHPTQSRAEGFDLSRLGASCTPLHIAALRENEPLVRALLACGARPNCPDRSGHTPLAYMHGGGATGQVARLNVEDLDAAQGENALLALVAGGARPGLISPAWGLQENPRVAEACRQWKVPPPSPFCSQPASSAFGASLSTRAPFCRFLASLGPQHARP